MPQGPTQYLIHEEGGLERWFNLTITNVGLEAVADYTCVAVNAGGVMEEAITLTFEEPEPVSLFILHTLNYQIKEGAENKWACFFLLLMYYILNKQVEVIDCINTIIEQAKNVMVVVKNMKISNID